MVRRKKTHDEFVKEVYELVGDEYIILGQYINAHCNVDLKHNIPTCGKIYNVRPNHFLMGSRCPCVNKTEKFKKKLLDTFNGEYILVGQYTLEFKRVEILHNVPDCMQTYKPIARDIFRRDQLCPFCTGSNLSKGEQKILDELIINGVSYQEQYKFDDCIYKNRLPFDFAIFKDDKISFLIEFDGGQHFEPIEFYGGKEGFEKQKLRDKIKNEYCKLKGINLIRIPYWKENEIKVIIHKLLNNLDLNIDENTYLVQ